MAEGKAVGTPPRRGTRRYLVCRREELLPGQMREVVVRKRPILVMCTEAGRYVALFSLCPHQGAPLSHGKLERMWTSTQVGVMEPSTDRTVIVCPWHNFEIDADTGCSVLEPRRLRVATYRVGCEGEDLVVYD